MTIAMTSDDVRQALIELWVDGESLLSRLRGTNVAVGRWLGDDSAQLGLGLIGPYLAMTQLQAPLLLSEVLRAIGELMIAVVGPERFAVYTCGPQQQRWRRAIGSVGRDHPSEMSLDAHEILARVASSGEPYVADEAVTVRPGEPLVVYPVRGSGDEIVGLLVIRQARGSRAPDTGEIARFDRLARHLTKPIPRSRSIEPDDATSWAERLLGVGLRHGPGARGDRLPSPS